MQQVEEKKEKKRQNYILPALLGAAGIGAGLYLATKGLKSLGTKSSGSGGSGGGGGGGGFYSPPKTSTATPPSGKGLITSKNVSIDDKDIENYRKALHNIDTQPVKSQFLQVDRTESVGRNVNPNVSVSVKSVEPKFERLQKLRDNTATLQARRKLLQEQVQQNQSKGISSDSAKVLPLLKTKETERAVREAEKRFLDSDMKSGKIRDSLIEAVGKISDSDSLTTARKASTAAILDNRSFDLKNVVAVTERNLPKVKYSPTISIQDVKKAVEEADAQAAVSALATTKPQQGFPRTRGSSAQPLQMSQIKASTEIMRAAEQTRDDRIRMLYEAALNEKVVGGIAQAENVKDKTILDTARDIAEETRKRAASALKPEQPKTATPKKSESAETVIDRAKQKIGEILDTTQQKVTQARQQASEALESRQKQPSLPANLTTDDIKQIITAELDEALYRAVHNKNPNAYKMPNIPENDDFTQDDLAQWLQNATNIGKYLGRQIERTKGGAKEIYTNYRAAVRALYTKAGSLAERIAQAQAAGEDITKLKEEFKDTVKAMQSQLEEVERFRGGYLSRLSGAIKLDPSGQTDIESYIRTVIGNNRALSAAAKKPQASSIYPTSALVLSDLRTPMDKKTMQLALDFKEKGAIAGGIEFLKQEAEQLPETLKDTASKTGKNIAESVKSALPIPRDRGKVFGDVLMDNNYRVTENPMYYITSSGLDDKNKRAAIQRVITEDTPEPKKNFRVRVDDNPEIKLGTPVEEQRNRLLVEAIRGQLGSYTPEVFETTTQGGQRVLALRYEDPKTKRRDIYRLMYFSTPSKAVAKFGVV